MPRRGGGNKTARRAIHEVRVVKATVPLGPRFKGYQSFVMQDLVLRAHVVRLRRERWLTPQGHSITAPLPTGVAGQFGPELRRFVLAQYHQGQVTVARLVTQLRGIDISQRQVMRLLIADQDGFVAEARDVLRAGLQTAPWISVDDTGARHAGANGVCTQYGHQHFTLFATTASKSRLNFLGLLRAGHTDHVINDAALAYMRERGLAGPLIARLPTANRARDARSATQPAARPQAGTVADARQAGDAAPRQWLGERYPLPGHQAKDQRRNSEHRRARLPRCFPWIGENLRQAGRQLLGLPRQQAGSARQHRHSTPAGLGQATRQLLNAQGFAPVTQVSGKTLKKAEKTSSK